MPAAIAQAQIDSHEERLQRVESNSEETRVDVAQIKTSLEYQQKSIDNTRAELTAHIDEGFARVTETQDKISKALDKHSEILEKHASWIATADKEMSESKESKKAVLATVKKVAIAGILAAVGVVGTKLAEALFGG